MPHSRTLFLMGPVVEKLEGAGLSGTAFTQVWER